MQTSRTQLGGSTLARIDDVATRDSIAYEDAKLSKF
jgi:hypothetical protein